jgi:hypothetical protein
VAHALYQVAERGGGDEHDEAVDRGGIAITSLLRRVGPLAMAIARVPL